MAPDHWCLSLIKGAVSSVSLKNFGAKSVLGFTWNSWREPMTSQNWSLATVVANLTSADVTLDTNGQDRSFNVRQPKVGNKNQEGSILRRHWLKEQSRPCVSKLTSADVRLAAKISPEGSILRSHWLTS